MDSARWSALKEILFAALELPTEQRQRFLDEHCAGDPELRQEIETLLDSGADAENFLAAPTVLFGSGTDAGAGSPAGTPALVPGATISTYKIVGHLGSGGMAAVYRAEDTQLGRHVAIKVLSDGWGDDRNRLLRFEREAQTLASLNHPHVAQIFGVDARDDVRFLVLELVEGEDLATRLERGPLSPEETIRICRQVAQGLEAAHELGVVHRDLKPANIRITTQQVAKVLDFGLAKPLVSGESADAASESKVLLKTDVGMLLGTPTYMSPERLKGEAADRRGDVWSFGCLLYECLTGDAPFRRPDIVDTFGAVIYQEPDLAKLPESTPGHVVELIVRCLDKNPHSRLQDMSQVRRALEGPPAPPASPKGQRSRRGVSPLAASAVAIGFGLLCVLATLQWMPRDAPRSPLAGATFTTITDSGGGRVSHGTISRDGKMVAYLSDRNGTVDVLIGHLGSDSTAARSHTNLTPGGLASPWLGVRNLGFNHDDTEVWLSVGGPGRSMLSTSVFGGASRSSHAGDIVHLDWSPDGSRVVYLTAAEGDPLFVADAGLGNPRRILVAAGGERQHGATWSLDGEWVYLSRGQQATGDVQLWRVHPDTGRSEQLTRGLNRVASPAPVSVATVMFLAGASHRAGLELWALAVETGEARRVGTGSERYISLRASKDGRRLVATAVHGRASDDTGAPTSIVLIERDPAP